MLYLEDFLELIENFPAELRDRFTEIRELDLQVQNALDRNEQRIQTLFAAAPNLSEAERRKQYDKIKLEYRKIIEDSDEKVNLATSMYDLVRRYLAKLDIEIAKFKLEVESDNPGITELIEQKSRNMEQHARVHKRERKKIKAEPLPVAEKQEAPAVEDVVFTERAPEEPKLVDIAEEKKHPTPVPEPVVAVKNPLPTNFRKSYSYPHRLNEIRSFALGGAAGADTGGGGASAALQQPVVRDKQATLTNMGFLQSFADNAESRHGRPRKLTSRVSEMFKQVIHRQESRERPAHEAGSAAASPFPRPGDEEAAEGEATEQNDQQRYCICNQVSYGEMVACDNKDCPFDWFHFQCVGITQPPKGKWYCPHCRKRSKVTPTA